ncbi:MAG: glycoside hydrolase family 15 protein, partial [Breznakibacter sp.]|nr:glycoside hydrolase family 15 protein [Breznakibacter sp.]
MIPNLNYSVIGNCRSAALISDKGSMDWCCLPEFDSPSIFAKILDYKKGGSFSFEVSEDYAISQKYLNNTNIVCTTFTSKNGVFEV